MRRPITVVEIFGGCNKISIVKKEGEQLKKYELLGMNKVVKIFTENDVSIIVEGFNNTISLFGVQVFKLEDFGVDNTININ